MGVGKPGDVRTYSYYALNREVSRFASVVKSMGVKKGEIVTIYMPQIPELAIAMLACAKIGAAHSVVYSGFSVEALAERIEDAESRVLITADGGFRRGKTANLKEIANETIKRSPTIEVCITVKRTGQEVYMENDHDFWYHDLMSLPVASPNCQTEIMDAEDMLFILYTLGTAGRPKGVLHTHGGYAVYTSTTHRMVFDIKDEDRWWCAADSGWITGHSHTVYGPLINGATVIMYEGAPNHPYPNRWWQMVEKYGTTILYTSPTAIRGLMRFGEAWPNRHDLSSLRLLGSVGEPINPEAWKWYYRFIGKEVPVGDEGKLVIKSPLPGMARTIYGDPQRYEEVYWKEFEKQGWYKTGDSAHVDEDGYFWIIGRIDDVIKVSGYRLGTAEVESALVSHPDVAEAAAIVLPHDVKGNAIHAYVILRAGVEGSKYLEGVLKDHVSHELGPIAKPESITFVDSLPETRSGKIMRRVLKARALGEPEGDLTTLEQ